jgi:hypothetical protein
MRRASNLLSGVMLQDRVILLGRVINARKFNCVG